MFIISLTYKKELDEVDRHLNEHRVFLEKYYAMKKLVFSGRKNPRTGGIIMAYNSTKEEVESIIKEDPFYQNQIADYEITEVIPTKYDENFKLFV